MLNIQIGNSSRAAGICCVSVGDGAISRGAYQVEIRSKITFPAEATVESFDSLITALQDVNLTYQALVEQKFAPEEFGVRSKAAIEIALDACARRRSELIAAAKIATTAPAKEKEELIEIVPASAPTN